MPQTGSSNKVSEQLSEFIIFCALYELECMVCFDLHIVHDLNFGVKLNNGSWNGMIGELIDKKADIALAPLSMTIEREKVVDFSPPILHSGLSIIYKKPKVLTFNIQSYLAPFSTNLWYIMAASVFVCCACLHFFRLSCNEVECKSEFHAKQNLFTIFTMITMQAIDVNPSKSVIRGVLWILWIWCIIMNIAYTANIFSVLAMSRKSVPFKSLYEFSNQDEYKPLVLKNSANAAFFKNSSVNWRKRIWKKLLEREHESFVTTQAEGRQKIMEKKTAFICDYFSILMDNDGPDLEASERATNRIYFPPHTRYTFTYYTIFKRVSSIIIINITATDLIEINIFGCLDFLFDSAVELPMCGLCDKHNMKFVTVAYAVYKTRQHSFNFSSPSLAEVK
ncbi:Glutamate receptor ionotropic, kainate 2 [Nymphon striatum]|nr:Glutamate receptor ionotropic, kainate 2 [Nymphon striatum]